MYPLVLHGAFLQDSWVDVGDSSLENPGISIAIPKSSGILEGISYQSTGSAELTIELPLNWYENNDLLGFALYYICVALEYHDPRGNKCDIRIRGNDKQEHLGSFSFGSICLDLGISDIAWIMCYPKVAIKECYLSNQWTHFMSSFLGRPRVESCGIHLIYAKDYDQTHPSRIQASSSHEKFGDHGSRAEDDYTIAHNKRSPIEQSPVDESHHKRLRGTQG